MQDHRDDPSEDRHGDPDEPVVRFASDTAADAGHGRERHVCKRRKDAAKREQQHEAPKRLAAKAVLFVSLVQTGAVIENVFDRRKAQSDNAGVNNAIEDVVEIAPKEEQKNK